MRFERTRASLLRSIASAGFDVERAGSDAADSMNRHDYMRANLALVRASTAGIRLCTAMAAHNFLGKLVGDDAAWERN